MKYLFILLYFFSLQTYSGFIDNKGLDCKIEIKKSNELKNIEKKIIIWFNNSKVDIVRVEDDTLFPKNKELDYLNYEESKYIDTRDKKYIYLNYNELKHIDTSDTIFFKKKLQSKNKPIIRRYIIDRKARILVTEHLFSDDTNAYLNLMIGKCIVFSDFDYIKKYQYK